LMGKQRATLVARMVGSTLRNGGPHRHPRKSVLEGVLTFAFDPDADLVAQAVRELVRRTRFPVAFGGLIEDGAVTVTSITGTRTRSLEGLQVRPERGLGGRAMTELRPRMTSDYGASRQITHDYDGFVLGEGLR